MDTSFNLLAKSEELNMTYLSVSLEVAVVKDKKQPEFEDGFLSKIFDYEGREVNLKLNENRREVMHKFDKVLNMTKYKINQASTNGFMSMLRFQKYVLPSPRKFLTCMISTIFFLNMKAFEG